MLRTMPVRMPAPVSARRSAADVFAGFRFVRANPLFRRRITLDLFAVLFGGAVALLPIFAKDILQVGPAGLGWLRAAPGLGAMLMALVTTRIKPWANPGRVLLWAVAGFGLAMIGFGFSRSFALSLGCLCLTGIFDNISVVIRLTLEQTITPDHLRGRVSAINYVFIGFSNEFGAFESGATAALFGPTLSVVSGGFATLVVVLAVPHLAATPRALSAAHAVARDLPGVVAEKAEGSPRGAARWNRMIANERSSHAAPEVSDNQWLRENGTRAPFIRRAVSKFMPGESFDEMIAAARATAAEGIPAVFTRLGENVKDLSEADAVAGHYLEGIDRVRSLNLDCEPSIKLTQLG